MIIVIIVLLLKTAYLYELLVNVSGIWNSTDKYSVVAFTRTKCQAVDIHYSVTYNKEYFEKCPTRRIDCSPSLMTHVHTVKPKIVSCDIIAKDFSVKKTSTVNYWFIPLNPEVTRSNCSLYGRHVVCEKMLSFGEGMPVFYSIALQSCDMNEVPVLNYSFIIIKRDTSACISKLELSNFPFCNFNYRPSLHGIFGISSVREYEKLIKHPLIHVALNRILKSDCHPFAKEFVCRNIFPECTDNGIIMTCRKMCEQYKTSCHNTVSLGGLHFSCHQAFAESSNKSACFYKSPPCSNEVSTLQNGKIIRVSQNELKYQCNFGYQLKGPKSRTCVDGNWKPSASVHMCFPRHIITIPLILGFAIVCSFVVTAVFVLRHKRIKKLKQEAETELRHLNMVYEFDAFVSYSSKNRHFVEDTFLSKLEPSYKLCIHGRDFLPGTAVVRNIMESLQKSAMCFIMLSRSYVESPWCTHEFTVAYSRLTSDKIPQNRLVVIALEDIKTLRTHQLPYDIQSFLITSTYIEKSSAHFWPQVMKSLQKVTQKKELISVG